MGTTTVDLFRSGHSKHARLIEVRCAHDPANQGRDPDVDSYVDPKTQDIWVSAVQGNGASSWDILRQGWRKPWRLSAGETYPDSLRLWNDDNPKGHWTWAPSSDMPLSDYVAALEIVQKKFKPA
jgi:hypothetical protein